MCTRYVYYQTDADATDETLGHTRCVIQPKSDKILPTGSAIIT